MVRTSCHSFIHSCIYEAYLTDGAMSDSTGIGIHSFIHLFIHESYLIDGAVSDSTGGGDELELIDRLIDCFSHSLIHLFIHSRGLFD